MIGGIVEAAFNCFQTIENRYYVVALLVLAFPLSAHAKSQGRCCGASKT